MKNTKMAAKELTRVGRKNNRNGERAYRHENPNERTKKMNMIKKR
jgi:hypothetical protein